MIPVLVAGAGPVGLALAGDLGWRGVRCLVIEQGDGKVEQPRMDMVSARSMEFCRRWSIQDKVREADYPQDRGQDIAYVSSVGGVLFGREHFPTRRASRPPPYSPQGRERCPQHLFDPILRDFAGAQPEVDLRYGVRLVDFEAADESVTATLETVATGVRQEVEVGRLVACDGAGSSVRQKLGIRMEGSGTLTRSVNILFRAPGLDDRHDKGGVYRFMLFGDDGPWATMVAITGYDVWRLQVIDGGDRRWEESDAHAAIRRALGFDLAVEILSINNWLRVEAVAVRFGSGRVFLAGDAAHTMSPTGGYGMNTGLGEAMDLSWKLEAVSKGWGGPGLLDSYEPERRPVALTNARTASENLRRMRALRPPAEAFSLPGAQCAWGKVVSSVMRREWFSTGILMGYRYARSPICVDDGEQPTPTEPWEQQALVGVRAPHAWIADGVSTLDWFGRGFVLVRCGADAPDLARSAAARGIPFAVRDLPASVLPLYGRRLTLVRPDGHIAWHADSAPPDSAALLDRVTGN